MTTQTTPDGGDHFHPEGQDHSHDGVIELNIPPWLIWSASLVGVGLLGWLVYDVWTQRRKPVSEQELRTTLRQREAEDRRAQFLLEPLPDRVPLDERVNGSEPVKAKADESPAL